MAMLPGVDRNKVYKLVFHLTGGYDKQTSTVVVDFPTEQERDSAFRAISEMEANGLFELANPNVIFNMRNVSFIEKSVGYV